MKILDRLERLMASHVIFFGYPPSRIELDRDSWIEFVEAMESDVGVQADRELAEMYEAVTARALGVHHEPGQREGGFKTYAFNDVPVRLNAKLALPTTIP